MEIINTLILSKKNIYVESLLNLLKDNKGLNVVECIESKTLCINHEHLSEINILIVHSSMVDDQFFKNLSNDNPNLKILVFGQDLNTNVLIDLIRQGVSGYINENMNSKHFIEAIEYILEGNLWVERHVLETMARESIQIDQVLEHKVANRITKYKSSLTDKEIEVMKLSLKGLSARDIADSMGLSIQAIKSHLSKLFKKNGVNNRLNLLMAFYDDISPIASFNKLIQKTLDSGK